MEGEASGLQQKNEGYGVLIIINEGPTIKTLSRLSCVSRFVINVLPNYYPTAKIAKHTKYKFWYIQKAVENLATSFLQPQLFIFWHSSQDNRCRK